uniref:Putative secreted protein n=1 Tax=Anopheles darlingi TaxID=43151 RepID=A0A2M4DBN8_ANODA
MPRQAFLSVAFPRSAVLFCFHYSLSFSLSLPLSLHFCSLPRGALLSSSACCWQKVSDPGKQRLSSSFVATSGTERTEASPVRPVWFLARYGSLRKRIPGQMACHSLSPAMSCPFHFCVESFIISAEGLDVR